MTRRNRDVDPCPGVSATDGCAELTTLPTGDHRAQQADMGLGNPTPGRLGRSLILAPKHIIPYEYLFVFQIATGNGVT